MKKLNYKVAGYSGPSFDLHPLIEKAFTHGHSSVKETLLIQSTEYPFSFTFNESPFQNVRVILQEEDLQKFDSSNLHRGYMRRPELPDTVNLYLFPVVGDTVSIKVW